MSELPRQRDRQNEASLLSKQGSESLQALHDDLAEVSPSFDGIVYFAKDQWHEDNASAVVTVQPDSTNEERFKFYKEEIANHRVDLNATALGEGLMLREPAFLSSRMNPGRHVTITHRTIVDDKLTGGLQTAFNTEYGPVPDSTKAINQVWDKHKGVVHDVAAAFEEFSGKLAKDFRSEQYASIGDVLELDPPTTPNAFTISWDLRGSTLLALKKFGPLRNYLLDTKRGFKEETLSLDDYYHDQGDGQDIALWLPKIGEGFDRANKQEVRRFGKAKVLPLIERLLSVHESIAKDYPDLKPHATFAIGLGYVEHDIHDARTSGAFWAASKVMKASQPDATVLYAPSAREILFPSEK